MAMKTVITCDRCGNVADTAYRVRLAQLYGDKVLSHHDLCKNCKNKLQDFLWKEC